MAKATFAAGCFWGVEAIFRQIDGVTSTKVGYTGGWDESPTYEKVCADKTGHAEAVELEYDPEKVSYQRLLEVFFEHHEPTILNREPQYRSAIFWHTADQQALALDYKEALTSTKKFHGPIVTQVLPAMPFYTAEEYHQKYFEKQGINQPIHIKTNKFSDD